MKLDTIITMQSPLSHIGETISTTTYLVQMPLLQPDGSVEEVCVYSGNAWRGQMRDLMASYMLDRIGPVPIDAYHLLYSGGKIGGEIKTDVGHARSLRAAVPMIALLGGGIGNQILPGKIKVGMAWPICREAIPVLPEHLHAEAARTSYRQLTVEMSYSRKDDAKDPRLLPHLQSSASLLESDEPSKKGDEVATQMRMTSELLIPGVRLYQGVHLTNVDETELGCYVSALDGFSRSPHIGGQGNRGHGLVTIDTTLQRAPGDVPEPFVSIAHGGFDRSGTAQAAQASYDRHVLALYEQRIADTGSDITALLGAA